MSTVSDIVTAVHELIAERDQLKAEVHRLQRKLDGMELTLVYIADCTTGLKGRNEPESLDHKLAVEIRERCELSLRVYGERANRLP